MKSDERFVLSIEEAQIVADNMGLVKWIVHHKVGIYNNNDFENKVQTGAIGLIKAVRTFDKSKNLQFATYALKCIMNEIGMEFRQDKKWQNVSFEQVIYRTNDGSGVIIEDSLIDEKSSNIEGDLENKQTIINVLSTILNCLKPRFKLVMLLSIQGSKTTEIAKYLGVSQSYASRLCRRSMKALKEELSYRRKPNDEIYMVDIDRGALKVSFFTRRIEVFDERWSQFLLKMETIEKHTDAKFEKSEQEVTMYLPIDKDEFWVLALLIWEMEIR